MSAMRRNKLSLPLAITFILIGISHATDQYQVGFERNVPVKMRDGVTLQADIYRPKADGRFPVLLQRTPYDKNNEFSFSLKAASRGYVVIIQDVRGRYTSEGEWYPFKHESDDGFDTVEWAATLPYSNGKVGMVGGSYVGATQMLAAIAHPPHLAGICPVDTASNYHDNWTYQGGAFEQWFNESWTSGLAEDTVSRGVPNNTSATQGMSRLPLASNPLFNFPDVRTADLTAVFSPYFLDWLAHPTYDDYWKRWSIQEHYPDINVPALTIAAWYDIFQGGSLRNYLGLKWHGGSEAARRGQHLIVTIGGHAGEGRKVGDVDFGPAAAQDTEDEIDWYDYLFKGVQNGFSQKPVKIFVMGLNQWRQEDDWPLARARSTKYFLHSQGGANSIGGNGILSTDAPHSEPSDHYVYDPSNPVPTIGGPLCCNATKFWPSHLEPGPRDQRPVEARSDVLVYSTPAFSQNVEVTGMVSVELYAASSAVDTDFTAKLVDVGPDGFAQNLTEGIIRARYRDSQEKPDFLKPEHLYKFTIDLWSTSNVFLKGHALRLEVSSSNFPRFDRNLNTAEQPESGEKFVTATNIIYHDAHHPSALILPIVPSE
jgi:putative CocE/NonD family hydrolase